MHMLSSFVTIASCAASLGFISYAWPPAARVRVRELAQKARNHHKFSSIGRSIWDFGKKGPARFISFTAVLSCRRFLYAKKRHSSGARAAMRSLLWVALVAAAATTGARGARHASRVDSVGGGLLVVIVADVALLAGRVGVFRLPPSVALVPSHRLIKKLLSSKNPRLLVLAVYSDN